MRILIGAVVGGVLMFLWGAVAHMATPLGHAGLSTIPADAEPAILGALKAGIKERGMYFIPGGDMGTMTESQRKEWEAKAAAGPMGLLIVQPDGGPMMTPGQLGTEFASNVLAALLGALIASQVAGGYARRVGVLVLAGLLGWASLSISYWNWYGFPTEFMAAAAVEEGVGWLIAGLGIAAVVKGAAGPVKARVEEEAVAV
jgi:hypothetical protein